MKPKVRVLYSDKSMLFGCILICITTIFLGLAPVINDNLLLVALNFLLALVLFAVTFSADSQRLKAAGLWSLVMIFCLLVNLELFLRAIPDAFLATSIRKVPSLAAPDRSFAFYDDFRFRGQAPCTDCEKKAIRIFTMGGSATFGTPMYSPKQTFASHLERMLSERRVSETYEVFNAGIPGHGITQIYNVLKEKLIDLKPDIVAVNCWFNDSAPGPGWYGVPGKTDWEVYKEKYLLWKLQEWQPFKVLYNTRTMGVFRYVLLKLKSYFVSDQKQSQESKKESVKLRMPPDQYREVLEEIVKLGKENNFLPIFMLEPVNRSMGHSNALKANKYYKVITKVAKAHSLPVVSALDQINERVADWLFYDFIHPNGDGHKVIAEAFYSKLFDSEQDTYSRGFLEALGVGFELPKAQREYLYQLDSKNLPADRLLKFKASAPFLENSKRDLFVNIDSEVVLSLGALAKVPKQFSLDLNYIESVRPINDLVFYAGPAVDLSESSRIGTSDLYSPVHIAVVSAGKDVGWTVSIAVAGRRVDPDYRSYNIVVLDQISGEVQLVKRFDTYGVPGESERLAEFLTGLQNSYDSENPQLVIIAVKTDGRENLDEDLMSSLFKSLGGSGQLPGRFESFILVGSPGLKAGTAAELIGNKKLELEIGDKKLTTGALLQADFNF